MKRFGLALLVVMALVVVATRPASAQNIRWGVGAGLLMPMGDYGDADKMGFTGGVGGTYNLPSGVGVRVDLTYGTTSEKEGVQAHKTKLLGGMASVVYSFSSAGPRPYVLGGLGLTNGKIDVGGVSGSETKLTFGFGAGVAVPMGTGGTRLFAEARYTNFASDPSLTYLPIVVGISFGK